MTIHLFIYININILDYDALQEIENNIPVKVPNDQYDNNHTVVATFNSISDVNNFCNTYNHANGYNGLKLGQRININTSKWYPYPFNNDYNDHDKSWYIAGFDMEYNHTASDGSIRNNGYGICLVPYNVMYSSSTDIYIRWHDGSTIGYRQPYILSTMHTSTMPSIASNLQTILGSHLVNRNVLLSSSVQHIGDDKGSTGYTWTTAYCTLMSINQLIGYPPSIMCNKYDSGEANYHLPLYNFMNYYYRLYYGQRDEYLTRAVSKGTWGVVSFTNLDKMSSSIDSPFFIEDTANISGYVIPMIYIR